MSVLQDIERDVNRSSVSLIKEALGKQFFHAEKLIDAVLVSLVASKSHPLRQNLICWGKGGFGKSEIVRAILIELDLPFVVFDFDKATTEEVVKGGYNLKHWHDQGELIHNLEKSLFAFPIVIIEEGLSAQAPALTSMRNPLSSRMLNENGKEIPVVTELIIMCTNDDPSDYLDDPGMNALLQRFPNTIEVDWKHVPRERRIASYGALIQRNYELYTAMPEYDRLTIQTSLDVAEASPRQALTLATMMETRHNLFDTPSPQLYLQNMFAAANITRQPASPSRF